MQRWCAFRYSCQHQWKSIDLPHRENSHKKTRSHRRAAACLNTRSCSPHGCSQGCPRLTSVVLGRLEVCRLPDHHDSHPGLAAFLALFGDAPSSADCPVKLLTLWQLQSKVRQIAGAIFSMLQTAESAQETKVLISLGDVGKCFPNSCIPYCKLLGDQPTT